MRRWILLILVIASCSKVPVGFVEVGEEYHLVSVPYSIGGDLAFFALMDNGYGLVHRSIEYPYGFEGVRQMVDVEGIPAMNVLIGGKWLIYHDDRVYGQEFDEAFFRNDPPDALTFFVRKGERVMLMHNGSLVGGGFDYIHNYYILNRTLAYTARKGNELSLHYAGKDILLPYDDIFHLHLIKGELSYLAIKDKRYTLVIGERNATPEYELMTGAQFNRDYMRFSYFNDGKAVFYFDQASTDISLGENHAEILLSSGSNYSIYSSIGELTVPQERFPLSIDGRDVSILRIGKKTILRIDDMSISLDYLRISRPYDIEGKIALLVQKGNKFAILHEI